MLAPAVCAARRARLTGLCLLLLLGLCGCGYTLSATQGTILGDSAKTLKVKGVETPTTDTNLGYILRGCLRDEIGARKVATWVDSGPSDYSIQINVKAFTMRSWMSDKDSKTLFFNGMMTIEAVVYSGFDNSEVWRSGPIGYSNTYESNNRNTAAEEFSQQVIRRLVDRMRNSF